MGGSMDSGIQSIGSIPSLQGQPLHFRTQQNATSQQLAALLHSNQQLSLQMDVRTDMFEEVSNRIDALQKEMVNQNEKMNKINDTIESLKTTATDSTEVNNTNAPKSGYETSSLETNQTDLKTIVEDLAKKQEEVHVIVTKFGKDQMQKEEDEAIVTACIPWINPPVSLLNGKIHAKSGIQSLEEFVEALRMRPWTLFPEYHEVQCSRPSCLKPVDVSSRLRQDKSSVSCPHCTIEDRVFVTALGAPKTGYEWLRFLPCSHYCQVPQGDRPVNCLFCGKDAAEYYVITSVRTPTRKTVQSVQPVQPIQQAKPTKEKEGLRRFFQ